MRVTIGKVLKKEYSVTFAHHMFNVQNKKKKRFVTYCSVKRNGEIISRGFTKLNPIDKLNRNLGKARAFQKAIKKYSRDERIIFWLEFHKNFKIRKENK
jgi:hypothetical protein